MLTEQQKQDIIHETKNYPHPAAAGPAALKIVQAAYGHVSDEHLREAATLLGMSSEELDGVATAYSLIFRQPVGRHVILLCDSVCCWMLGYSRLKEYLLSRLGIERLGQTSPDGGFTLLPVACLGACDHAPALLIDGDLHGDLTEERLDALLVKYP